MIYVTYFINFIIICTKILVFCYFLSNLARLQLKISYNNKLPAPFTFLKSPETPESILQLLLIIFNFFNFLQ